MACRATVVLPDASGPKTSITLPLGNPPTPRAISNAIEPLGITSTALMSASPILMMAPLPYSFSSCANAAFRAFCLSDNRNSPFMEELTV